MHHFIRRVYLLLTVLAASTAGVVVAQSGSIESNATPRTVKGKTVASERDEQESLFNYYFQDRELKYETKLDKLKPSASVPNWRIPYSADIHPQVAGGLSGASGGRYASYSPLATYDRAFNGGRDLASSYETQRVLGTQRTLFPGMRLRRNNEGWEGYCSGFTASTIRHPEPIRSVDAGDFGGKAGVVFQPSDIKALLSSIYNRTTDDSFLFLAPPSASDGGPNMGTFHLALANYIGQAGISVGFDRTKGRAPWNNPVYTYEVKSLRDAGTSGNLHLKTVSLAITYSYYGSDHGQQTDSQSGDVRNNIKQQMNFQYNLALDNEGRIVGGQSLTYNGYFLWAPLYPVQATADGKTPGNPHIDVTKVLAIARASALPATQAKFDKENIGPKTPPTTASTPQPDRTASSQANGR